MKLSQKGAALIKSFEGCQKAQGGGAFVPYVCPAGVLTIGWGHTNAGRGRKFAAGDTWSQADCDQAFVDDMATYEDVVNSAVKVPLQQYQFDALVSFAYNCGPANLRASTLLRKLNAGDYAGAALEFHKWNKGGGVVLKGLVRRRAAEALFFQDIADLNFDGAPDMPQAASIR